MQVWQNYLLIMLKRNLGKNFERYEKPEGSAKKPLLKSQILAEPIFLTHGSLIGKASWKEWFVSQEWEGNQAIKSALCEKTSSSSKRESSCEGEPRALFKHVFLFRFANTPSSDPH
jgi:hypothetical protein